MDYPWVEIPTLFLQVSDEVAKAIVGKYRQPSGRGASINTRRLRCGFQLGKEGSSSDSGRHFPPSIKIYEEKRGVIYQLLVIC